MEYRKLLDAFEPEKDGSLHRQLRYADSPRRSIRDRRLTHNEARISDLVYGVCRFVEALKEQDDEELAFWCFGKALEAFGISARYTGGPNGDGK